MSVPEPTKMGGDIEEPVNFDPQPTSYRAGAQANMQSSHLSACSVFFSKDDADQTMPSLPVHCLIEGLRNKYGKTAYCNEFSRFVENADGDGDGLVTIPELMKIIEQMHDVQKQNANLKRLIGVGAVSMVLVLLAIFGLVFAVVELTQQLKTGGETGNALISKSTGVIVDTHPSDGGGIFLEMAAFTRPVNISFPGFDKTQTCVGQVSSEQINKHYNQFTIGGSDMTIRHVDYSEEGTPVIYTNIPGSNLAVTGLGLDEADAIARAEAATEAIINAQAESNPEGRKRHLIAAARLLNNPEGSEVTNEKEFVPYDNTVNEDAPTVSQARFPGPDGEVELVAGKGRFVSRGGGKPSGRRLQDGAEELELVTVEHYMLSFADQEIHLAFTKDPQLTNDYYFVCHSAEWQPAAAATNEL